MNINHTKFKAPFTCTISGPSGSGKTVYLRRVLQHFETMTTIINKPLKVIWAYGQWQELYKHDVPNVIMRYSEGLPSLEDIKEFKPDIICIDDLMAELSGSKELSNLFTKGSHHMNISVFFVVQNFFNQAKEMRNITLNSHYIVMFKNPRDSSQVMALARQIFPKKPNYLLEAAIDATLTPYSYVRIDLKADTPENFRVSTRTLPEENEKNIALPVYYKPKNT